MPRDIDRREMEALVEAGAQIVEVLEEESYQVLHLPGAVNIPLWELDDRARKQLDPGRPIAVYCNDFL